MFVSYLLAYSILIGIQVVFLRFDSVALAASTDALNRLFSNDIAPLRAKYLADQTPEDDAIRDSLKPWGISTFPAYVMYPANPAEPPFLVSDDLLSQDQVLEALNRATAKSL